MTTQTIFVIIMYFLSILISFNYLNFYLGISTIGNRDVPPLMYDRVYRLIDDFPHLSFEINGAIKSPGEMMAHFESNKNLKGKQTKFVYLYVNTDVYSHFLKVLLMVQWIKRSILEQL